ncbi:MAG: T9SS type A sorting domain-containing protein [Chlorobi bacterium]|nr:T9SS type A sorting domain-containing protein [Chlorobiota bacterium]
MHRKTTISFFVLSILLNYNIYSQINNSSKSNINSIQIDDFINLGESVNDLFIDPEINNRLVAIVSVDTISISTDNGITRIPTKVISHESGSGVILFSTFSFNPSNPDTGYLAAGGDLLKTVDRGVTWDSTNMFKSFNEVDYVVYDPISPDIVFVSNFRPMFYETHLFRSTDGGNSWAIVDTMTEYEKIVFNSLDANVIYGIELNSYIRKSIDSGETWETVNNNLSTYWDDLRALEISKSNPDILYCGQLYNSEHDNWILAMTTNGGESWERIDSTLLEIDPEGIVLNILVDQYVEGRLYVSYTGGLYLTEDNGKHFQKIYSGNAGKIWSDNKNPATIYFNSDQGLLRFIDTVTVGVEKVTNNLPDNFRLEQNYPNPFNPSTIIKYSIPRSTEYYSVPHVTLRVFDILGEEITTLVNKEQKSGNYEVEFNANKLASGLYFYRLTTNGFTKTMKMILLK